MARSRSKPPTQRQLKVGETIRHKLSEAFAHGLVRNPDLMGQAITVSEVRMSPDLRHATAYVMPLGGGDNKEVIVKLLKDEAKYLQHYISGQLAMKFTPRLKFELDMTFEEASLIDHLLQGTKKSDDA
ncbi:MAG: 30S ribosome-binding factor RbfA [Alphaproteobacteria bacterium]